MKERYCEQCGDPIPSTTANGCIRMPSQYKLIKTCGKRQCKGAGQLSRHKAIVQRPCCICGKPIPTTNTKGQPLCPSKYLERKTCLSSGCMSAAHISGVNLRHSVKREEPAPLSAIDLFIMGKA